jgi:hypothetical protein
MKIAICIPTYNGQVHRLTLEAILKCHDYLTDGGLNHVILFEEGSLVNRVRDHLAARALEMECTHTLWLDADIGGDAHIFLYRCLNNKLDLAFAPYRKKQDKLGYNVNWLSDDERNDLPKKGGYGAVRHAGMGCAWVSASVFQALQAVVPSYKPFSNQTPLNSDKIYHYFETRVCPETDTLLSEDYSFCDRCREAGYQCWLDLKINLVHVGCKFYENDSQNQ